MRHFPCVKMWIVVCASFTEFDQDKKKRREGSMHLQEVYGALYWFMLQGLLSDILSAFMVHIISSKNPWMRSSDPDSVLEIMCELGGKTSVQKKKAGTIQETQGWVKLDETSLSFYCCIWEVIIHPSIRWIHHTDQWAHSISIPISTINICITVLLWLNLNHHSNYTSIAQLE